MASGELTALEHEAMDLTAALANKMHAIIKEGGDPNVAAGDWAEAAQAIHVIQNMILSQAAGRAYPKLYRVMGQSIRTDVSSATD